MVLIRREQPEDVTSVHALTEAAFPEPVESRLLAELRADEGWIDALSLVAEEDGEVVGHVVCTRGRVGEAPALGLGPISVRPDRQRTGIGSALVHAVVAAAEALGEPVVVLLGDPAFYGRLGFRPAAELGIMPPVPEWAPAFQARPLASAPPTGPFRYAAPFERV
jgi:putative acetyltransferase